MIQVLLDLWQPPKGKLRIREQDRIRIASIYPANFGVELTEQDCIELINQYHPSAIEMQNQLNREFVFDFEQITKPSLIENLVLYLDSDLKVENLEKLENLQGLHLSTNGFLSVDYTKLRKLKRLSMTYDPKNTTWMNTKSIENLELYKCGKHRDFNFLSAMESLQILNAVKLPVHTLNGLEKLPKLKAFSIDGFNKLENYEEIGGLTELEYLRILNPPANINFDFLVNLKKLKWLWLDAFKITFKRDNELPNLIQYPASDDQKIKDIRGDKRLRPFDRDWWRNGHEFFPDNV